MRFILVLIMTLFSLNTFANFEVSEWSIQFFDTEIGDSNFESFDIENQTNHPIRVDVNDDCSFDFYVSHWCGEIPPHGSCQVDIEFAPTEVDFFSCEVLVEDEKGNYEVVEISGEGVFQN